MPLGRAGALLDELIAQTRPFLEREGVVQFRERGSRLEPERVAVDGDDLIELRSLGRPPLLRLAIQAVLLRPGDRVDIDRAPARVGRAGARIARGSSLKAGPGIRMVVALEHEVNVAVVATAVDQIAGVNNEACIRSAGVRGPDNPRPVRLDAV